MKFLSTVTKTKFKDRSVKTKFKDKVNQSGNTVEVFRCNCDRVAFLRDPGGSHENNLTNSKKTEDPALVKFLLLIQVTFV